MRRLSKRRLYPVFLAVWMTAQVIPVTMCHLSASAGGGATPEATPTSRHCHRDERREVRVPSLEDHRERGSVADPGSTLASQSGAMEGARCCDDPLMSCCIDALRTMVLASKDGTGCDHAYFAPLPPQLSCLSTQLVVIAAAPRTLTPGRPPPASLAVVFQL